MAASRRPFRMQSWVLLVALAMVMRVFVPQGMMVQQADSGTIEIAICNSDATWSLPVKTHHAPAETKQSSSHCVFAGHGGGGEPPLAPAMTLPELAEAAYDATRARALSPNSPRSTPPARAPPFLV